MKRLLLALPLLLGCNNPEPRDTGGLATSELSLQVLVEADELETRLSIGLYARGYTYARLDLVEGERLLVRVPGSEPIELTRAPGIATYQAKFAAVDAFELDLERGAQSVRGSVVELPRAFAFDTPERGIELTKPFTLRWSPVSNDPVKLSIAAPCLAVAERTLLHDPGAFTWSAADFGKGREPLPCTATIHARRAGGALRLAPGFAGVQLFRAEQLRAVGVLASP